MTAIGWLQIVIFCAVTTALARPLGGYMTRLFAGERTLLAPVLGPVERGLYRAAGVDPAREQGWVAYGLAMLAFNLAGFSCSTPSAAAGCLAAQPPRAPGRAGRPRAEH